MKWIRNSRGNPDALLTFAALAVIVVLFRVVAGALGKHEIDAALVGAVLAPTLGAYTAKRIKGPNP